jgi:hypothetical protein
VEFRKWAQAERTMEAHNGVTRLPGSEMPLVVKFADAKRPEPGYPPHPGSPQVGRQQQMGWGMGLHPGMHPGGFHAIPQVSTCVTGLHACVSCLCFSAAVAQARRHHFESISRHVCMDVSFHKHRTL